MERCRLLDLPIATGFPSSTKKSLSPTLKLRPEAQTPVIQPYESGPLFDHGSEVWQRSGDWALIEVRSLARQLGRAFELC